MTMNQMQYFSTVCRYHNITKAAKILMISQPGLSARLSELEAEVGVKLLERTSKGVSPTEEGARLLAHVEAVLGRYRLLQNDLPAIAQGRSTVRVGFRPYSGEAEMIQLCRDFQQCFPETRVVFNEMRNVTPSLFLDALAKSCERSELTTYQVTVMRKFEIEDNIPVCGRRRARCRRRIFYAS